MITNIRLKFGSAPEQTPVTIDQPMITIFVGPNNSGKSQVLREIHRFCESGNDLGNLVLDNISFEGFTEESYSEHVAKTNSPLGPEGIANGVYRYMKINNNRFQIESDSYKNAMLAPNENKNTLRNYTHWHSRHFLTNLNAASRMELVNAQARGNLTNPQSVFAKILTNDEVRSQIRSIIHDAFGLYFGIDMSQGNELHLRFGDTSPPRERTVEDDMLNWTKNSKGIEAVSDGVKAFTGMLIQLYVGNPKIITIDEPEAFLHPSLAFKLGQELAKLAVKNKKHIFVSTHSSQFLMGVIQSAATVNIVRLTYEGGVATARTLSEEELKSMMDDPFLRSANVMSGLFYKHVIVTEADSDRAFYQEINERLLKESVRDRGCSNTLFLNANGKDTVHRIVAPLRRLGIPAAAIVDLDILNQGGTNWTNHLSALSIPTSLHQPFGTQRANAWNSLTRKNSAPNAPKINGGLSLLEGEEKEAAENLLSQLREYGFFIVPIGEVERWLPDLDIDRGKHTWLRSIFEKMGNSPDASDYLKPKDNDVWAFVNEIGSWLKNPKRKGIPVAKVRHRLNLEQDKF